MEPLYPSPRGGFNAACRALGLDWDIDGTLGRGTGGLESERDVVRSYVTLHRSHLLSCYDVDFLVELVLARRSQGGESSAPAIEAYSPL